MNGEIFFNMLEQQHPISGSSKFLMKRWTKHTVFYKSGSYIRTTYIKSGSYGWENGCLFTNTDELIRTNDPIHGTYIRESNPLSNDLYDTQSVYLYDYVIVSDTFFKSIVYTASIADTTPSLDGEFAGTAPERWNHREQTFRDTPNSITNNYKWRFNLSASLWQGRSIYGTYAPYIDPFDPVGYARLMATPIYMDDGNYFEIVKGYPRSHFTHKRDLFSMYNFMSTGKIIRLSTGSMAYRDKGPFNPESMDITRSLYAQTSSYYRNRQTNASTIGQDGLEDGSAPVQAVQVGNLKLVQTDNVINH